MSERRKVYIDFVDQGVRRVKTDEYFYKLLSKRFDLKLADTPDFLVHSHDAEVHRLYSCKKIFWTAENYAPDFSESDYALTCRHLEDDPRHLRWPIYSVWVDGEKLVKRDGEAEEVAAQKNKFCCFFTSYANRQTAPRINFFQKLSARKKVDSAGKALNNIGYNVPYGLQAKIDFMRPYKFYMAFENSIVPGYITEKIGEAMQARCIPIYWGDPRIAEDFNPKSFLNYHDFPNEDALIDRILEIDSNPGLYLEYLREPFFHHNTPNQYYSEDRILDFFEKIFTDDSPPIAAKKKWFSFGRWMLVKRNKPHRRAEADSARGLI